MKGFDHSNTLIACVFILAIGGVTLLVTLGGTIVFDSIQNPGSSIAVDTSIAESDDAPPPPAVYDTNVFVLPNVEKINGTSLNLTDRKWFHFDFLSNTLHPNKDEHCLQRIRNNTTKAKTTVNLSNTAFVTCVLCSSNHVSSKTTHYIRDWIANLNQYHPTIDKLIITHKQCCNQTKIIVDKVIDILNTNIKYQTMNHFENYINIKLQCFDNWNDIQDFDTSLIQYANKNSNCCGIKEFYKIDAFSLIQYDYVFLFDWDIRLIDKIDELFDCMNSGYFDFLGSNGAKSPLNGGLWIFKTNKNVLSEMKYFLKNAIYDNSNGWFNSNIGLFRGSETNQGFGFWYFFIYKQFFDKKFHAKYLVQTIYDCQRLLHNLTKIKHKCKYMWGAPGTHEERGWPHLNNYIIY